MASKYIFDQVSGKLQSIWANEKVFMNQATLVQIEERIERQLGRIRSAHPDWPCRSGCDDCCRSLSRQPQVSKVEWERLAQAMVALPVEVRAEIQLKIAATRDQTSPVTCPFLNTELGLCRVYAARPWACRSYGYYAERDKVLGCYRIELLATAAKGIVWGNHLGLKADAEHVGETKPLVEWLQELG